MRLNASEPLHYQEAMKTKITSNGVEIKYCLWFDTELGIAECAYAVASGSEDDVLKTRPLYSYSEDKEFQTHTYYLHTFEVWQDGQQIAKV